MKKLLSILFIGLATAALAQESQVDLDATYFHPAASMYIQGNSAGASNLVATGLSSFPDNGKLLRLKELLDQQQEEDQDQQNEDQEQDQEQNEEQEQDENQEQDQEQNQDQEENQDQNSEPEQQEPPEQQPPSAEEMSKDEAERLLDAMKQEEENKRLQLHPVMGNPVKVDKDW